MHFYIPAVGLRLPAGVYPKIVLDHVHVYMYVYINCAHDNA